MHRRAFLAASSTLALSPLLTAAPRAKSPELDLDLLLEVMRTPGLAARGMVGGKPFAHAAGIRATGKPDRVTAQTRFSAASLTKPVFAMAVRQLVRDGKLSWTRPLQEYLPLGLTGEAATITARHVLSHSTGLPN